MIPPLKLKTFVDHIASPHTPHRGDTTEAMVKGFPKVHPSNKADPIIRSFSQILKMSLPSYRKALGFGRFMSMKPTARTRRWLKGGTG